MLTFAFAVAGGSIDQECLGYQSRAISFIREKLTSEEKAASAASLGAILLLAGVEVSAVLRLVTGLLVLDA